MRPEKKIYAVTQKLFYPGNLLMQFLKLVNGSDQSYFPRTERKSKWSIWLENVHWVWRHREINRYYYIYGLDRKGNYSQTEKLGYRKFRRLRDTNLHPKGVNFNYACLLRDKFVFGQLLTSLQFPTPKNIALIDNGELTWLNGMRKVPLSAIAEDPNIVIDGFCKQLAGLKGEGAFRLRIAGGKIYSGAQELTVAQLQKKISGKSLWQERVEQHPDMSRLNASSVNTMRILTFNNNGRVELFSAALRIGGNNRTVDNWNAGGIAVAIDLETGMLREEGFAKPDHGGRTTRHPETGVVFLGYQLPFFKESVDMVCRLHRYLYGIHSIGWDVAVTPDGPILIEANDDWDGSFAMTTVPNFKSRFLRMYQ
jgi:hypothetical protein